MLIDRIDKAPSDYTRIIEDMTWWLDAGETLGEFISVEIIPGMSGWTEAPYPPPDSPPPYDPTPLLMPIYQFDSTGKLFFAFVSFGTAGVAYTLRFVLRGSSSRVITVEVGVQVTGMPPEQPLPVPIPPSQAAGQEPGEQGLNIQGGTMQGPLYLFQNPQYPTEAVTKNYVDTMSVGAPPVQLMINAADDVAAAAAGVPYGGIYRNGSVLQIRAS